MERILQIDELLTSFEEALRDKGYASEALKTAARLKRCLKEYADECGILLYSVEFGQRFLASKYPEHENALYVSMPHGMRAIRRSLILLDDFWVNGKITRRPIKGNDGLRGDDVELLTRYEQKYFISYAAKTTEGHIYQTRQFLRYLNSVDVAVSDVSEKEISGFLYSKPGQSRATISIVCSTLRRFLKYLFQSMITLTDLSLSVPKVHATRLARIPSVWKQDDIEKLLAAVDRGNPVGKRDYAILLSVIKMGLRAGDVFSLRIADINWAESRIELTQSKTGQPIILPLQDDVGWAIIDYLKNGRPDCDSPIVFVSHSNKSIGEMLSAVHGNILMTKYIRQAGIQLTKQQRHGLHSLRHTLAARLLEAKTPLPVISEILGQVSADAIEKYLKVDIESLRQCALNPEEVLLDADSC